MSAIMQPLNALGAILISILAYQCSLRLYRRTHFALCNPLLVSLILIMGFMYVSGFSHDAYAQGGRLIEAFLGPATVILAVPLYRMRALFRKHWVEISAGILSGCLANALVVWGLARLLGLNDTLMSSFLPRSVTTPIGIEVSASIGGLVPLTVFAIILTGITGACLGPAIFKLCRVTHSVSRGIALGTASHAMGTAKALELGEAEGAMSSLAIGVAGLVTAILLPIFHHLIQG